MWYRSAVREFCRSIGRLARRCVGGDDHCCQSDSGIGGDYDDVVVAAVDVAVVVVNDSKIIVLHWYCAEILSTSQI